eukprot:TRINITY_DN7991_c0_g1_i1.p2 TRINITY_DN7991_c0_g1~~TRINITY_DN7991_c0_g1_i1.p2  ORF type:complete len:129 (+),score=45.81 TRINITY_DN7991_c0_g1_i1:3-389(+)
MRVYNILLRADRMSWGQSMPLFSELDVEGQSERLMQMIGCAIDQLPDLESLIPVLQVLGRRHLMYNVMPHHYEIMASALLSALAGALGEEFTPSVSHAWVKVYGLLAKVMMDAAAAGPVEDEWLYAFI